MKLSASILGTALTILSSRADAQTRSSVGLAAGATVPVSSYGDDKNVGYHLGLFINMRTPTIPIGLRIDGTFSEMRYSGHSTREQIWMANGNVVVRAPTAGVVTPYLLGGAGIYNRHRTLLLGSNSSTSLGLNVGAGFRFGVSGRYTLLEARYHVASGRNEMRIVPISFGVTF